MTDEIRDIDSQLDERRGKRTGASISIPVHDPRVSNLQNWLLGAVGTGIITSMIWMATSIDTQNRNFAAFNEWKISVERRLSLLEADRGR